jgi:SOS response regulatory protein OraA/RecX
LQARLAERGTSATTLEDAIETLERAGLVDDARVGAARAEELARRGFGDAAIRFTLEGEGLAVEVVSEALATLEPEPERARTLLDRRGRTPKTVRWLAAKGFDAATLEDLGGFAQGA